MSVPAYNKKFSNRSPRIMLTLPPGLLDKVDAIAARNYTFRSVIIRQAIIEMLNQQQSIIQEPAQSKTDSATDEHPDDVRFQKFMAALQELEQ